MFPFEPLEVYTLFDSVLPTSTGVYAIVNRLNGKYYIGSARAQGKLECTTGFRVRFASHRSQLRNKNHHCKHLQNSYNYYVGELGYEANDVYQIWILEYIEPGRCLSVEQSYIDTYWSTGILYNDKDKAVGGTVIWTPEMRLKRSQAQKGRTSGMKGKKHKPESIEKIIAKCTGQKRTNETKALMSAVRMGIEFSDEHRANLSEAQRNRKIRTKRFFVAISPEEDFIYFANARAFCDSAFGKKHKFSRSKITACARGRRKHHQNFKFLYIDDFFAEAAV